jgi:antitoxin (DNA-binding transcriptional repressor) of toxin-antitoxin stability system
MTDVASRELRNDTRGVLRRVEAGEDVTITVDGRPVAVLRRFTGPSRTMSREEFVRRFLPHRADAALTNELALLAPDTTDDVT